MVGCPSNQSLVQQSSMAADLNQVNYVMEGGKDDNNEEDDKNDADADDGEMNEEESGNRPRSKTLSPGSPQPKFLSPFDHHDMIIIMTIMMVTRNISRNISHQQENQ